VNEEHINATGCLNTINGDNLNNIRLEASRHFRNKRVDTCKTKLMSLQQTVRTRTLKTCIEE
jgi:hypothetical protein